MLLLNKSGVFEYTSGEVISELFWEYQFVMVIVANRLPILASKYSQIRPA